MSKIAFLLIAIAILGFANAATLKGTVYDKDLQPITAIVTVNSTPEQTMVTQNGSFQFQVTRGHFKLNATVGNVSVIETVSIITEGTFNVDLVLVDFDAPDIDFPNVTEESGFENGPSTPTPIPPEQSRGMGWEWLAVVLFFLIVGGALFFFYRELKKTEGDLQKINKNISKENKPKAAVPLPTIPEDTELTQLQSEILKEIAKNEGRMNQKELRKILPFSEAKISIELDLLEEKGLIKKFKKGRGNVIVLPRK